MLPGDGEFFVHPKYIYIFIGSLATFFILIGFLFIYTKEDAKSAEQEVLGVINQTSPSSTSPVLVEKNIPSKSLGVTSIDVVTIAHTVKEGDSLASIAKEYNSDMQTIADFPNNQFGENFSLNVGSIIIVPAGFIGKFKFADLVQGNGFLGWPVRGEITQIAFPWHAGALDIALKVGDPVHSAKDGVIKDVEMQTTGYGYHVVVDHGNGVEAIYAHLSKIDVTKGQYIAKGEILGLGGSTGRSTGPHLHFEVRRNNQPVDPLQLLGKLD